MRIGIIAGNRSLPMLLAKRIREKSPHSNIIVFAFRSETDPAIAKYADKVNWLDACKLQDLSEALEKEEICDCIMIGQINPLRIFQKNKWDQQLKKIAFEAGDFRPHSIFSSIISFLELKGLKFLDSTSFLSDDLAEGGVMNGINISQGLQKDIDFGKRMIRRYVDLDIGQTIVVKGASVVALESLEGTDQTIKRAYRLAGRGCTVLKFCKKNQDLRFDVAVVGISTLNLLKSIKASCLVLEKKKVIILDKEKFLSLSKKWGIAVIASDF
ncbi:MAG: UDP-2,3-diacylglucosamine diphosphatase LpxI [Candidatus Omnitrophica bacterium]|nr:UDP-2,3-diacylglucosamine diphosphatase LpxI [Candidatus Omnitrophota bacterium]